MLRSIVAILVAAALGFAPCARANNAPPPTTDPEPLHNDTEQHKYSVAMLGGLGAGAGAAIILGAAFIGNAAQLYIPLQRGPTPSPVENSSNACQPCTDAQLTPIRAYYYSGIALLSVGAVLAVTDIALAVIDHNYRKEHRERRISVGPAALRVRF